MNDPPRPPGPMAGFFDRFDYLVAMASFFRDALLELLYGQRTQHIMTDSLQSGLDRNTAASSAASAAMTQEIAQLKTAIQALNTSQAPTQAQLDQLNAASAALESATAALVADDPAPAQ